MEQRQWREIEEKLKNTTLTVAGDSNHQILSSIHSLIINPSTTHLTISTIFKTLTHSLSSLNHHHTFSLLAALSLHHPTFIPSLTPPLLSLTTTLLSDTSSSPRLAAVALSLLLSIDAVDSLDDALVISLCFRPCVSVRVWFLKNALRFAIRPNLLLTVMLGFTKDPYPCVRKAALDGLVGICGAGIVVEDFTIVEGCYRRAVELLRDQHDYVRLAAIRAVNKWGYMLAASQREEEDKRACSNGVFLQICSMVRDMNAQVRAEAFNALGKIVFVSEDILLQTLSKRVLGTTKGKPPSLESPAVSKRVLETIKGKPSLASCSSKSLELPASIAAGAFTHGLEDEYSEVQQAACISLRMLPDISDQFAGEAVHILSYALNDDAEIVRLEVLRTIHHMVTSGCPKMREEHIDMLLGTLGDSNSQIRSEALKIIGSVKLPDLKVSRSTVVSLLGSLDMYPKSEAEVVKTLFNIGQNHGNHAATIIEEFYHEIEPSSDCNSVCNSPRVAGLLVLAISASLKHEKHFRRIPPKIFSYAAAFFGRITSALGHMLDTDSLLAYLSYCGECHFEGQSEARSQLSVLPAKGQQEESVHVLNSVELILATVERLWQLVRCGCTDEVLKALRCCKDSLRRWSTNVGVVAFALQYIHIVKILTKVWGHFVVSRNWQLFQMGELELLLSKLENAILALRYKFIGLSEDVELFVMELLLLNYLLQLSRPHIHRKILQKLSNIVENVELLRNAKSSCSNFVNIVSESFSNGTFSLNATCDPIQLKNLLNLFMLRNLLLSQDIKNIKAELVVIGFDPVTPLGFISGLPITIPMDITLYNVTNEHRLWLKMSLNDAVTEFVFFDEEELGGREVVRQIKFNLPFYRTPKAVAFTLRVSMGVECVYEDLYLVKAHGGPRHVLTYISKEIELYFVNIKADHPL